MTQTLGTNSDNDIYVGSNGNLIIDRGQQAVLDACATAAKLQLGEAVLETGLGLPNFQTVWVGAPNIAIFENYLRRALLNVQGVTAVKNLTTSVVNNTLSYTAVIETIFGRAFLNG